MKRILTMVIVLFCMSSYGQLYQAMPQPGYGPVKRMWIDSVLVVPTNVTSGDNLSGGREVGKIRYNITDSSLQAWTGYQWRSGGSGTTPTWQQTLAAGSTLTGNNTIAGGGFDFIMNNTDEIKFGSNAAAIIDINNPTNIIQIGDVGAVFQSTLFTVDASDELGKFTADNSIHDARFGINTTSPDSALQVVGGIHGTRGLRLSSLTNLATQNRLLGQFGTDG